MNQFIVTDIIIDKNRIDYEYTIEGDWKKFFTLTTWMKIFIIRFMNL